MSDVMNVQKFFITVKIVLRALKDLLHQNVIVLMDT